MGQKPHTKERDEVMQRSLLALGTASEVRQEAGGKEINPEGVFLKLTEDF
jgi:hypothetical protein